MSFSTIYADSFRAYENKENISAAIQSKVDKVADNEVLFGSVDYSSAYEKVNQNMREQIDAIEQNAQTSGTEGTDGTNGATSEETTVGDAIFGKAECTDGKDDGKIGFFEGVGSFFKGIGKAVVNTVTSIVTDPKKLLLTAGAVALSIAFPPAGVAMAVAGGVAGAVQVGKGIYNAATAKTDAEAKEALESMGSGTLQVGLSVVGAKAGLKAMSNTSGSAMSALKAGGSKPTFGQTVKAFAKDTVTGGRGASWAGKGSIKTAWTDTSSNAGGYMLTKGVSKLSGNIASDGVVKGTWESAKEFGSTVKNSYQNAKAERVANKEAQNLSKNARQGQKEMEAIQKKLQNKKLSDTQRAELTRQLEVAKQKVEGYTKTMQRSEVKNTSEIQRLQNELDAAQRVQKKIPKNGAAKAKVETLKQQLEAQKQLSAQTKTSLEAQSKLITAQEKLAQAKRTYENLGKNATEAQVKAAKEAVANAKAELANIESTMPQASAAGQARQAINEEAKQAGYQGNGNRPFLSATLGPMAYELESA